MAQSDNTFYTQLAQALTPTQMANLFPRYYRDRLPDISGFTLATEQIAAGTFGKGLPTPVATGEASKVVTSRPTKTRTQIEDDASTTGEVNEEKLTDYYMSKLPEKAKKAFDEVVRKKKAQSFSSTDDPFGKLTDEELKSIGIKKVKVQAVHPQASRNTYVKDTMSIEAAKQKVLSQYSSGGKQKYTSDNDKIDVVMNALMDDVQVPDGKGGKIVLKAMKFKDARALTGNFLSESSTLNTQDIGDEKQGLYSVGIGQWNRERKDLMFKKAEEWGMDPHALHFQALYSKWELQEGNYKKLGIALAAAETTEEKYRILRAKYEVGAGYFGEDAAGNPIYMGSLKAAKGNLTNFRAGLNQIDKGEVSEVDDEAYQTKSSFIKTLESMSPETLEQLGGIVETGPGGMGRGVDILKYAESLQTPEEIEAFETQLARIYEEKGLSESPVANSESPTASMVDIKENMQGGRNLSVNDELNRRVSDTVSSVLGPGWNVTLKSGGIEGRLAGTSRRHTAYGPKGEKISIAGDYLITNSETGQRPTPEQYALLGQYWLAKRYGSIGVPGANPKGAGKWAHFDMVGANKDGLREAGFSDDQINWMTIKRGESPFWYYGGVAKGQAKLISQGLEGKLPDNLYEPEPIAIEEKSTTLKEQLEGRLFKSEEETSETDDEDTQSEEKAFAEYQAKRKAEREKYRAEYAKSNLTIEELRELNSKLRKDKMRLWQESREKGIAGSNNPEYLESDDRHNAVSGMIDDYYVEKYIDVPTEELERLSENSEDIESEGYRRALFMRRGSDDELAEEKAEPVEETKSIEELQVDYLEEKGIQLNLPDETSQEEKDAQRKKVEYLKEQIEQLSDVGLYEGGIINAKDNLKVVREDGSPTGIRVASDETAVIIPPDERRKARDIVSLDGTDQRTGLDSMDEDTTNVKPVEEPLNQAKMSTGAYLPSNQTTLPSSLGTIDYSPSALRAYMRDKTMDKSGFHLAPRTIHEQK